MEKEKINFIITALNTIIKSVEEINDDLNKKMINLYFAGTKAVQTHILKLLSIIF